MKINLVDKNGVTLKTAGTYVDEDLEVGLSESDKSSLVAENVAEGITILGVEGTFKGGGVEIPSVSNIQVLNVNTANEKIQWDAPDLTDLAEYNPTISYIVNINGNEFTTTNTYYNSYGKLVEGENVISVKVMAKLNHSGDEEDITTEVSKPELYLEIVSNVFSSGSQYGASRGYLFSKGNKIYHVGGYYVNSSGITSYASILHSIDADTLSAGEDRYFYNTNLAMAYPCVSVVGDMLYILGGQLKYGNNNKVSTTGDIYKIDMVNKTTTKLDSSLPYAPNQPDVWQVVIDNIIYQGYKEGQIIRFDTITDTYTQLDIALSTPREDAIAIVDGTNIYILSGIKSGVGFVTPVEKIDIATMTVSTYGDLGSTTRDIRGGSYIKTESAIYCFGNYNSVKVYAFDIASCTLSQMPILLGTGSSLSYDKDIMYINGVVYFKMGTSIYKIYGLN